MNTINDKKESIMLDPIMIMNNLEYLKDHLVMEDLVNKSKKMNVEEDLDKTILICISDYEDWVIYSLLWFSLIIYRVYIYLIKL